MKLYFPGVLAVILLAAAVILLGSSEVSSSRYYAPKESPSSDSDKIEKVSKKVTINTVADTSGSKSDLAVLPVENINENGEIVDASTKMPN